MEHKLNKDEIAYFYELLYKFEHGSRAGYQDDILDAMIGKDDILDDNHQKKDNISIATENTIHFTPYYNNKCWGILYHVRNAIAHGNIKSVDEDRYFLIQDFSDRSKRQMRNMYTKIEKDKFYHLINVIEKSRKIPSEGNKMSKSNTDKK